MTAPTAPLGLAQGLAIAIALAWAPTPVRGGEPPQGDLARLQGTWAGFMGPEKDLPITVKVNGSTVKVIITYEGKPREMQGEVRVDDQGKPHKTLDWIKFKNPDGDPVADIQGIYRLDGDEWVTCGGGPGNPRPTEFKDAAPGEPHPTLITFKRRPAGPEDETVRGDLARLQGLWSGLVGARKDEPATLTIKGRAVTVGIRRDGQYIEIKGQVRVDEQARPYPTVDFTKFVDQNGDDLPDNLGIYRLVGDEFLVCYGGRGNPRPTELKNAEGDARYPSLVPWRRRR